MGKRVVVLVGGVEAARESSAVSRVLRQAGHEVSVLLAGERLEATLRARTLDACFLALGGPGGEDGQIQALLEKLALPYTGSGALATARATDRSCARGLLAHANLPVVRGYTAQNGADALARHGDLGFPCWVMPARGGAARAPGQTQVEDEGGLEAAVGRVCALGGCAVVEKQPRGWAVSVGLLDGRVLGSLAWGHGPRARCGSRPGLSPTRLGNVEVLGRAAYQALGCRGYAQVTLVCTEEDNEAVLEVDPRPALTPRSLFPRIARDAGLSFEAVLERILALAALDVPRPVPAAPPLHQAA